jgi:beta-lactam-binding protein with PASTA domain
MDVPKDIPSEEEEAPEPVQPPSRLIAEAASAAPVMVAKGRVPDFSGMSFRGVVETASANGLAVMVNGRGIVRAQEPPPGAELPRGSKIRVLLAK